MEAIRCSVEDGATKKRVTAFEPVFGAPMHLYVVREDAGVLRREKPVLLDAAPGSKNDGVFVLEYTFATGGAWRLFAEVAPQNQGVQTLAARVSIPGAKALPENMMAQIAPLIRQNGITLRFARPTRFVARQTVSLPLVLEDGQGNPLDDLQMGDTALAHLYFAEKNGKAFVHAVPDTTDPSNGRTGSRELRIPVRFEQAGTYRAWLAVTRTAQPVLVTFVVRVSAK